MIDDVLMIDVAHDRWKDGSRHILNNLVQVLFDQGHQQCKQARVEPSTDDKQYWLLEQLMMRGYSTYVGYKALEIMPADGVEEYSKLKDPAEVARLLAEMNTLLEESNELTEEELRARSRELGIRGKAYYVVGAHIARTIDENIGRERLVKTVLEGPKSFVAVYNELVQAGEQIAILN